MLTVTCPRWVLPFWIVQMRTKLYFLACSRRMKAALDAYDQLGSIQGDSRHSAYPNWLDKGLDANAHSRTVIAPEVSLKYRSLQVRREGWLVDSWKHATFTSLRGGVVIPAVQERPRNLYPPHLHGHSDSLVSFARQMLKCQNTCGDSLLSCEDEQEQKLLTPQFFVSAKSA